MNTKQKENYLSNLQDKLLKESTKIKFNSNRAWIKDIPETPGVYILREEGKICYVGESGNLKDRMISLLSSTDHCVRRNIGHIKYSNRKGYEKATAGKKFPPKIEKLLNIHFNNNIKISCIEVDLGRKELEEKIRNEFKRKGKNLYNKI